MAKICPFRETEKSGVYGEPCREEKCELWDLLNKQCSLRSVSDFLSLLLEVLKSISNALEGGRRG